MKIPVFFCALFLISAALTPRTLAQKAPLPKDLPAYGPEKPLAAPSVKAAKLDNGLTVWFVSEPGFPQIALDLAVRGGYAADSADRPGISQLLATTVTQGTATRSAKQIAQEIQAAGGDLSGQAQADSLAVSTTILSEKADLGMTVFADVVQHASFADSEVALAKRNAADDLQQRESETYFLARRAMAEVLFGDHPYHVIAPTTESINASTPADLRKAYTQRFRPDQAVLVVVGDFQDDKMMDLIRTKFGDWKAPAEPPLPAVAAAPTEAKHSIFIVPRPGSVQTTFELAAFAPVRNAPDYEAAQVVNAIYGGEFGSRLVLNIREDKGYTYSPYSYIQTRRAAATIVSHADVRNAVTGPSFNEITYELNRMVTTSPTEEELTTARRYLVGGEAIQLQARSSVASELAGNWIDGLPPEEIGIYGAKINNTTVADVDAAALKYFPAARTATVVVGEERVIRDALSPFGLSIQTLK